MSSAKLEWGVSIQITLEEFYNLDVFIFKPKRHVNIHFWSGSGIYISFRLKILSVGKKSKGMKLHHYGNK